MKLLLDNNDNFNLDILGIHKLMLLYTMLRKCAKHRWLRNEVYTSLKRS